MSKQRKRTGYTYSALRAHKLRNRRSTMNAFNTRQSLKRRVKPLIIALAVALPGSAALAASMDDVVKTRADQNIDQQYGRDSVYAFSPDAKPLKPEQTGSHDMNLFGTMKNYAAEAWHKSEGFAVGLWGKTTGLFHGHEGASSSVAQVEPQGYGRAGGFVGADRIEVLDSSLPYQANSTPNSYQTTGTPIEVKTGAAASSTVAGGPSSESSKSMSSSSDNSSPYHQMDTGSNAAGEQSAPTMGAQDQSVNAANPDSTAPVAAEAQGARSDDNRDSNDSAQGPSDTTGMHTR